LFGYGPHSIGVNLIVIVVDSSQQGLEHNIKKFARLKSDHPTTYKKSEVLQDLLNALPKKFSKLRKSGGEG
jgi:hypothetical protein